MSRRPAYYRRLMPLHEFESDHGPGEPRCKRVGDDGRLCGLPRNNRHHDMKAKTAETPRDDEPEQLRLDVYG